MISRGWHMSATSGRRRNNMSNRKPPAVLKVRVHFTNSECRKRRAGSSAACFVFDLVCNTRSFCLLEQHEPVSQSSHRKRTSTRVARVHLSRIFGFDSSDHRHVARAVSLQAAAVSLVRRSRTSGAPRACFPSALEKPNSLSTGAAFTKSALWHICIRLAYTWSAATCVCTATVQVKAVQVHVGSRCLQQSYCCPKACNSHLSVC